MLSEIRNGTRVENGVPDFTASSMKVLDGIRDREGGDKAPRFEHTSICLTNGQADLYNWKHLEQIEGDEIVFPAVDQKTPHTPRDFNVEEVSSLGYRTHVTLKVGCRVMTTINHPNGTYANGPQGVVTRIETGLTDDPRVHILLDGESNAILVCRERYTLSNEHGEAVFIRDQLPIMVAAAMTAHRTIGLTLNGIWLHLPFKNRSKKREADEIAFWQQEWLEGCIYTALSRVGSRQTVRVDGLRRASTSQTLNPMFTMGTDALEFDAWCRSQNSLIDSPTSRCTDPSSTFPEPDRKLMGDMRATLDSLVKHMEDAPAKTAERVSVQLEAAMSRTLLYNHFATLYTSRTNAGKTSINPVVYCMSRGDLRMVVEALSTEHQWEFYGQLDEYLNITVSQSDGPDDEKILEIAKYVGDTQYTNANDDDNRPRTSYSRTGNADAVDAARPTVEACSAAVTDARVSDQGNNDDTSSCINSEGEAADFDELSEMAQADAGSGKDRFEQRAFLICEGSIHDVVVAYLAECPHYNLTRTTIDRLKSGRASCILECQRSVSYRFSQKTPISGSKPDWRCWPQDACPLREVCVVARNGNCYFYGEASARASREQWRSHAHIPGSTRCRSAFIPPPIIDDWLALISESPGMTRGDLINWTMRKHLDGGYRGSRHTFEFMVAKKLESESEKVRAVMRSLRPGGKSGLSVEAFIESLAPLRCSIEDLVHRVKPVIMELTVIGEDILDEEADRNLLAADNCLVLGDILCTKERADNGRFVVNEFCMVATSARMLNNMRNCGTIGVDCSFNIVLANMAIVVVCALPRGETALPVALGLVHAESASSVAHCLRQIKNAAVALCLTESEPREVVMDGSASIHAACESIFNDFDVISCFFHVVKRAREAKAKARLPKELWGEVLRDLTSLACTTSRIEWEIITRLFIEKWTNGNTK
ncbi:hypothetical protein Pmar_PMAR011734 [Perkinsus marinus ATCC 50983]|uniref:MULE transposase domain-containing protein n=1 Tax=Perkinsus marinus (strain ATCC 50983 / TXsc) TaxID=423536 RepID=C5LCK5_PERM5|nr:hypothetical protein Pmar_PMAR011734 [Perkinsus marinus ATCC 50983]EER05688.1 hypothetical protein Pmar_PMAR011734 [Perkinsus marinus ATCC 50983]|eukprot:XP_002773872.1 hypothetical protein Pmar_PMAR011734 [Perkinsus marinus ATCC 50983]